MSDLLPVEVKTLQLGFVIENEQKERQQRQAQTSHRTTSDDYQQRKRQLAEKYRKN